MSPIDTHEPTPEFRERLQWQIETALRRETRLAAPVTATHRWRAALVVVAALATGGLAGIASEEVQDARQRDRLIESVRSEEAIARLRLDLARAELQELRQRFDIGAADREIVETAEQQLRQMETTLARLRLDIEEIQATAAAPRNDLDAPLVGRRDFVRERLTLELQAAQRVLVTAERAVERARQRVEIGLTPPAVRLRSQGELAHALAELQRVRATLEMRDRALRGEIKGEELVRSVRRMELTVQLQRVEQELEMARARVREVHRLVEIGTASPLDFKRAEVDLLEREAELKRLRTELERLGAARR